MDSKIRPAFGRVPRATRRITIAIVKHPGRKHPREIAIALAKHPGRKHPVRKHPVRTEAYRIDAYPIVFAGYPRPAKYFIRGWQGVVSIAIAEHPVREHPVRTQATKRGTRVQTRVYE